MKRLLDLRPSGSGRPPRVDCPDADSMYIRRPLQPRYPDLHADEKAYVDGSQETKAQEIRTPEDRTQEAAGIAQAPQA